VLNGLNKVGGGVVGSGIFWKNVFLGIFRVADSLKISCRKMGFDTTSTPPRRAGHRNFSRNLEDGSSN